MFWKMDEIKNLRQLKIEETDSEFQAAILKTTKSIKEVISDKFSGIY